SRTAEAGAALRPPQSSEVALALAILHRCVGEAIVGASRAPFGDAARGDLVDDLGDTACIGRDRTGAARVTHGAIADRSHLGLLVAARLHPLVHREEHAVPGDDLTLVSKVDRGEIDVLALDVPPDVELGPV